MASELRWEQFLGVAAACPPEWPFGTWVEAPGHGDLIFADEGTHDANCLYIRNLSSICNTGFKRIPLAAKV
jgi:hypothetical protein